MFTFLFYWLRSVPQATPLSINNTQNYHIRSNPFLKSHSLITIINYLVCKAHCSQRIFYQNYFCTLHLCIYFCGFWFLAQIECSSKIVLNSRMHNKFKCDVNNVLVPLCSVPMNLKANDRVWVKWQQFIQQRKLHLLIFLRWCRIPKAFVCYSLHLRGSAIQYFLQIQTFQKNLL